MATETQPPRWNYRRRAIGAALCFAPVVLIAASLAASASWKRESVVGLALASLALLVAVLNVFIALRPQLIVWRYGSMDGFRNVSGVPLVGTGFAVLAGVVGFGDWRVAAIALLVLVFDFGGLPWLLIATWRDSSIWDE